MDFILTLALLLILLANAKIAGEICERIGYNAVLGELLLGTLLGPSLLGILNPSNEIIAFLAEVGVLFLLFEIGLESNLKALLRVGIRATMVAIIGVVCPMILGFGMFMFLGYSFLVSLLVGATMTATSVGITMRVFSDLKKVDTVEGRIILSAAVIDDVLGLLILAIIAGLAQGQELSIYNIGKILLLSVGFLIITILLGVVIMPSIFDYIGKLKAKEAIVCFSLVFAGFLGIFAQEIGLAAIVGVFLAGLLLTRTNYAKELHFKINSISSIFIPFFFIVAGAHISLTAFTSLNSLTIILVLLLLACIGKIASGLAVKNVASSLIVGIGMIPRGEVGLIFAQYGLTYSLIDSSLYSVLVTVILLTTFITPILLKKMLD